MRLSCVNCLTEYDVPDAALAGRARTLRCAHCGHQWQHAGVAPEAAAVVAPPDFAPQVAPEPAPVWSAPAPEPAPSWPAPEPVIPIDPGYSWAPPPQAPAGWPEFATEMSSRVEPLGQPALRNFGQPEDELAQAELVDAANREGPAPFSIVSHEFLPSADQLAVPVDDAPPAELPPLSDADFRTGPAVEADSFAALVSAARRKSLELEPEPPPPPPKVRTSNKKFFVLLIVLLVIAVVVLEHRQIEAVLPASAGLFGALGLH